MAIQFPYVLGLDLGVASVGWAVMPLNLDKELDKMVLGVRCFNSGTGTESEIESGKDESRNTARRAARGIRKNLKRRSQRMVKLMRHLQEMGLLPMCDFSSPDARNQMFTRLDQELGRTQINPDSHREAQVVPFLIRAYGLDHALSSFALGRAIYHLAQHRGYKSNRKTAMPDDKEEGAVKQGISELEEAMEKAGCRTLGEYFSALDPEETRIRARWTSREMHETEFELLWERQKEFHPCLTPEWKEKVHHAIFFQRPLKSQRGKLGKCELEPTKRRAPIACLEAQRFRYWQKILDLKYCTEDSGDWIELTREQQDKLAELLENQQTVTFSVVKKAIGFKAKDKIFFNLESGPVTKLRGNSTSARLKDKLPEIWDRMTENEKALVVDEILQFEDEGALQRRLERAFHFTPTEAVSAAAVQLENGYANLSRKALKALLALMVEKRIPFKTAEKELYGSPVHYSKAEGSLPPLCDFAPHVVNPIVTRTLTELRKVVNAIVREYGRPERIVVELARDMKKSRKERQADVAKIKKNTQSRDAARARILKEFGILEPSRNDIMKVQLAEECGWICPYTGKQIAMRTLLGSNPQFDIEHILPMSRSLDDSYANKTLCDSYENRNVKRGKTPFEAYGGTPKFDEILARIREWKDDTKKRRFMMTEIPQDFTERLLNDTRYMSRLAISYLGQLYGGEIEAPMFEGDAGRRRVYACTGKATSWLRDEWNLNGLLNTGRDYKTRTDHRHHAVDAAVIALCTPKIVQMFAKAAGESELAGSFRRFQRYSVELPHPDFVRMLRLAVSRINVSWRANRKVSGALHEETFYSKPYLIPKKKGKVEEVRHKRIPLEKLAPKDLEKIIDGGIRKMIEAKAAELGGDFKKFKDPQNHPYREVVREGKVCRIPVHQVRIQTCDSAIPIGKGAKRRYVKTGSNHHMEVFALLDENGNETKWDFRVVTLLEAYERRKKRQPVVCRDFGPGTRFKFSIFKNDYFLKTEDDGTQKLYRVFKMDQGGQIGWGVHTDARPAAEVTDRTPGNKSRVNPLRGRVQKVRVDFLGNIHPTND